MEQRRNYTIDFIRLIMAMFIVALHSNPFAEYSALISYFSSQVLSRLGFPFLQLLRGITFSVVIQIKNIKKQSSDIYNHTFSGV